MNTARWTTVRGTPTVSGGSVNLPITNGDIDGANAGAISYLGQAAPAGAWTATTKLTLEQDNEWQYAGLLLHVDDDNYTKLAFTKHQNDSRFLEFWSETGGSRTGHGANITVPTTFGTTVYVRLTSDGTQLTAHYSTDGEAWTQVGTAAPLKAGAKIGPVAAGDVDAQNQTAAFDWFRFTPDGPGVDPGFDDEFDGPALDGCRWDKIKGWKSSRLELADGKLGITTFDADISGADNGPIENLILQTPPEGDWTVETKMTAPLKDSWQLGGFMLHADNDHYVKYDVVADNAPGQTPARRVELRYENGGPLTGPTGVGPDLPPPASATDTWWLRLTKTGNTYTGAISADGETWQQTPGSVTVELTDPGLGLMAIGPQQSDGPIDILFDYIKVVEEPTNTEPVIDAATATRRPASRRSPCPSRRPRPTPTATRSPTRGTSTATAPTDATRSDAAHTYTLPGTHDGEADGVRRQGRRRATRADRGAGAGGRRRGASAAARWCSPRPPASGTTSIRRGHRRDPRAGHRARTGRSTRPRTRRRSRPQRALGTTTRVFLSTTGDVLNAAQQAAFEDYIRAGGGYAGIHSAADTEYGWRWYGNLVGAYFRNHPAGRRPRRPHGGPQDPSTAGLPALWTQLDEWYNYKAPAFAEVGDADYTPRNTPASTCC